MSCLRPSVLDLLDQHHHLQDRREQSDVGLYLDPAPTKLHLPFGDHLWLGKNGLVAVELKSWTDLLHTLAQDRAGYSSRLVAQLSKMAAHTPFTYLGIWGLPWTTGDKVMATGWNRTSIEHLLARLDYVGVRIHYLADEPATAAWLQFLYRLSTEQSKVWPSDLPTPFGWSPSRTVAWL